jgi:peptide-methionine (S)-S-oxide reductase
MSKSILSVLVLVLISLTACFVYTQTPSGRPEPASKGDPVPTTGPISADVMARAQTADFAAGCFWGSEATFRAIPGVLATEVGFEGGSTTNPSYEDVCTDKTGHAETVRVLFDPQKVSYKELVDVFFEHHDPTTVDRQGPDFGTQYRSVIFYHSPEQKKIAEADKHDRDTSGDYVGPIVTEILPAKNFYRAEDYHQQYFSKQGVEYQCHLGNGKKSTK